MGARFIYRGKGHDKNATGFLVEGIEIDRSVGNAHASHQIVHGIRLAMGDRDAVLHTGRHFPFTIEHARPRGGLILYLAGLNKNIEKFVDYRLFAGTFEVKIDGIGGQYGFEVHKSSVRLIIGKVKVFRYNIAMKDIDKFFSDGDRIIARWRAEGTGKTERLASALSAHFLSWCRSLSDIAGPLASYWETTYGDTLGTEAGRKAALEWFGALHALLHEEFDDSMDFPEADWDEIRETINAEADSMDLDLLSGILTVIVERGHA